MCLRGQGTSELLKDMYSAVYARHTPINFMATRRHDFVASTEFWNRLCKEAGIKPRPNCFAILRHLVGTIISGSLVKWDPDEERPPSSKEVAEAVIRVFEALKETNGIKDVRTHPNALLIGRIRTLDKH
jgi:hypothetical protein